MEIDSYSVSGPVKGLCKQSAVWVQEGSVSYPLFYIGRPKWIKDDKAWKAIVDSIRLDLKDDALREL